MPPTNHPRRRALLTGALVPFGAALFSGCSDTAPRSTAATGRPAADPGTVLRRQAAQDSTTLLARYNATAAAHPDLAAALTPLRAEVARHAKAFGAGASARAKAAASPPLIAEEPSQALADLVDAERRLSAARTTALLGAPAELARLLASVAGAGAAHALLLNEAG